MSKIQEIFGDFFIGYLSEKGKPDLKFVVTSLDRQGDPATNPHALPGNAMDFVLKRKGDFAPISDYNDLFAYMMANWPFRAGIDNTWGNIHIHIDLGENRPTGQIMPFFFKEDDGIYKYQINKLEDIV